MPMPSWDYETVAANQSAQVMGPTTPTTKAAGSQFFKALIVIPATTSPGAISIKDGSDAAITVFTGGASSVSSLVPFTIPILAINKIGSWQVTTGDNVSCIAVGRFT